MVQLTGTPSVATANTTGTVVLMPYAKLTFEARLQKLAGGGCAAAMVKSTGAAVIAIVAVVVLLSLQPPSVWLARTVRSKVGGQPGNSTSGGCNVA